MLNMISSSAFEAHLVWYQLKMLPILILIEIIGIIMFGFIFRKFKRYDKYMSLFLGFLWIFDGIVHQVLLGTFKPVQKATMGTLYSIQAILFIYYGVIGNKLDFNYEKKSPYSALGVFFALYALFFYPLLAFAIGRGFPKLPVLGLICPSTIYTFGFLLLTTPKMPKPLLIIPCWWATMGGLMAIVYWSVWCDIGLVAAGVIGTLLLWHRPKNEVITIGKGLQM